jgi:hypothetical protein
VSDKEKKLSTTPPDKSEFNETLEYLFIIQRQIDEMLEVLDRTGVDQTKIAKNLKVLREAREEMIPISAELIYLYERYYSYYDYSAQKAMKRFIEVLYKRFNEDPNRLGQLKVG